MRAEQAATVALLTAAKDLGFHRTLTPSHTFSHLLTQAATVALLTAAKDLGFHRTLKSRKNEHAGLVERVGARPSSYLPSTFLVPS